jgi:hypothetical protein
MLYRDLTVIHYFNIKQIRVRKAKERKKGYGNEKKIIPVHFQLTFGASE